MVPGHLVLVIGPAGHSGVIPWSSQVFRLQGLEAGVLTDCSRLSALPLLSRGKDYGGLTRAEGKGDRYLKNVTLLLSVCPLAPCPARTEWLLKMNAQVREDECRTPSLECRT